MAVYLSSNHKAWSFDSKAQSSRSLFINLCLILISPVTFLWPMVEGLSQVDKNSLAGLLRISVLSLTSTRDCGSF